jgi:hypothetical protein
MMNRMFGFLLSPNAILTSSIGNEFLAQSRAIAAAKCCSTAGSVPVEAASDGFIRANDGAG